MFLLSGPAETAQLLKPVRGKGPLSCERARTRKEEKVRSVFLRQQKRHDTTCLVWIMRCF